MTFSSVCWSNTSQSRRLTASQQHVRKRKFVGGHVQRQRQIQRGRVASFSEDLLLTLQKNPPPKHVTGPLPLDWYAGFLQGRRSSFSIGLEDRNYVTVMSFFSVNVQDRQLHVLVQLWQLFGQVGHIIRLNLQGTPWWNYRVCATDCVPNLLPIIDKMPLKSKKLQQYFLFRAFVQNRYMRKYGRDIVAYYSMMRNLNERALKLFKKKQKDVLLRIGLSTKSERFHQKFGISLQKLAIKENMTEEDKNKWKYQIVQASYRQQSAIYTEDFVTGLVDANGNFKINFQMLTDRWPLTRCQCRFTISQSNDLQFLQDIQWRFFENKGTIRYSNAGFYSLTFTGMKDIVGVIIPFFLRNPLKTAKYEDFERFATVVYRCYYAEKYSVKLYEELVELIYSGRKEQKKEMLLEYLNVAKTREQFHKVKPRLQEIKEQFQEKFGVI
eukprot:TRINITY_DN2359_c0_g1_i1.p1 TRINITY_DN2359_c0_g1~~TRINITY_DN2359_c0_g1_i1.p1  ORF type:complete len:439 (-),score=23.78 TRINITY_DN2359_c0_g1_i1:287-1603(-)